MKSFPIEINSRMFLNILVKEFLKTAKEKNFRSAFFLPIKSFNEIKISSKS